MAGRKPGQPPFKASDFFPSLRSLEPDQPRQSSAALRTRMAVFGAAVAGYEQKRGKKPTQKTTAKERGKT